MASLCAIQANRLAGFDSRVQRRVLGISWKDHISNEELRRRSLQPTLLRLLAQRRQRWRQHVLRMPDDIPTRHLPLDINRIFLKFSQNFLRGGSSISVVEVR